MVYTLIDHIKDFKMFITLKWFDAFSVVNNKDYGNCYRLVFYNNFFIEVSR